MNKKELAEIEFAESLGFFLIKEKKRRRKSKSKPVKKVREISEKEVIECYKEMEEYDKIYGEEKESFREIKRKLPKNRLAQIYYSKKAENVELYRYIEQTIWHINQTHTDHDKYLIFLIINSSNNEKYQYGFALKDLTAYKLNRIVALSEQGYHVYVSQNTYIGEYKREKRFLWKSEALIIDIDYYKLPELKNLPPKEIIDRMRADKTIQWVEPSYVVYSGNGLYLVYLLNPVPLYSFPKNGQKWEAVAKAFVKIYAPYGADPQATDISRVNRIPLTTNHKTGRQAEIIDFEAVKKGNIKKYELMDLHKQLCSGLEHRPNSLKQAEKPLKPSGNKKVSHNKADKNENKAVSEASKTNMAYQYTEIPSARIHDIYKLIKLRQGNMQACRNFAAFIFALCQFDLEKDYNTVLKLANNLNKSFTEALPEGEIEKTVNSAYSSNERKRSGQNHYYSYPNKSIVEKLNISEKEQQEMKTLIFKETKQRRQKTKRKEARRGADGLTSRERDKKQKVQTVQQMLVEGLKQREIAERMGISERMVRTYVKLCK